MAAKKTDSKVAPVTKTTKGKVKEVEAPSAPAKGKTKKATGLEPFSTPKSLLKCPLNKLYDETMKVVRTDMELDSIITLKTPMGKLTAAKVINPLGVSAFSTVWQIDGITLSKAVLKYLLAFAAHQENDDIAAPTMEPAVGKWLANNPSYRDEEMGEAIPKKKRGKKQEVVEEEEEEAEEEAEEVEEEEEEEEPAPKAKGKGKPSTKPAKPEPKPSTKKGKKAPEPEPEEEEDGLTEEEFETEVKLKATKKALSDFLEDDELEAIIEEAFGDDKVATIQSIFDALASADFDTEDEDLINCLKELAS